MEKHIARPIPGFEGYYASNKGFIYSKKLGAKLIKKIPFLGADGYYTVGLTATGETIQKRYKIHRMVALTWLVNPEKLPIVNHIDADKINNAVANLEWVTYQRNVVHAFEKGLINTKKRPVRQLGLNGKLIAEFESIKEASIKTGVNTRSIQQVCSDQRRLAGDFGWVYKENYKEDRVIRAKKDSSKTVHQFTLSDEFMKEYSSVNEAAKAVGCKPSSLAGACRGEQKTCMGFKWRYAIKKENTGYSDLGKGTEDWTVLDEYPHYRISRDGKIYSMKSMKMLNLIKLRNKRLVASLSSVDNIFKRVFIHRLVAEAYIPNPDNCPVVNHLDGNPSNNSVENLEWTTHSGNSQHAYDTGLNKNKTGVIQFDLDGKELRRFDSVSAAAKFVGVTPCAIHYVLSGKGKQSKGYVWKRI